MNIRKNVVITLLITISIIIAIPVIYFLSDNEAEEMISLESNIETTTSSTSSSSFYVDVKGAVKNPGVYFVSEGSIVQDAINLAGGLKKNATTKNINLSQKLQSEMVIYIFSKTELKTETTQVLTNATCTTNVIEVIEPTTTNIEETTSQKVNINTASKEELMTLDGVGSSKADSIIIYRNKTKFENIEDIMNVSGIGESAFAKIKENITV